MLIGVGVGLLSFIWILDPAGQVGTGHLLYDTRTGQTIIIDKAQRWSDRYQMDMYLILRPHKGEIEWVVGAPDNDNGDTDNE